MKPIKLNKELYSKKEVEGIIEMVKEEMLQESLLRLDKSDCDLKRIEDLIVCFDTNPKRIKAVA